VKKKIMKRSTKNKQFSYLKKEENVSNFHGCYDFLFCFVFYLLFLDLLYMLALQASVHSTFYIVNNIALSRGYISFIHS